MGTGTSNMSTSATTTESNQSDFPAGARLAAVMSAARAAAPDLPADITDLAAAMQVRRSIASTLKDNFNSSAQALEEDEAAERQKVEESIQKRLRMRKQQKAEDRIVEIEHQLAIARQEREKANREVEETTLEEAFAALSAAQQSDQKSTVRSLDQWDKMLTPAPAESEAADGEGAGGEQEKSKGAEWGRAVAAAPVGQPVSAEAAEESVEIPELKELGFTFTEGTQGNEVSTDALMEASEREHEEGKKQFGAEEYSSAASAFCKAGCIMMHAQARFHGGEFARQRASQCFVQMAIAGFNADDATTTLQGANAALSLDAKLGVAWEMRSEANLIKGDRVKARGDAYRALDRDPTNEDFARLLLRCARLALEE